MEQQKHRGGWCGSKINEDKKKGAILRVVGNGGGSSYIKGNHLQENAHRIDRHNPTHLPTRQYPGRGKGKGEKQTIRAVTKGGRPPVKPVKAASQSSVEKTKAANRSCLWPMLKENRKKFFAEGERKEPKKKKNWFASGETLFGRPTSARRTFLEA